MHLAVVVLAVATLAGCLQSGAVPCGGGRICPSGTQCEATLQLCVLPEQLGCPDEGAECSFGADQFGFCRSGVCVALVCGDGVRVGDEECDGDDLGGATCESLHFYETRGDVTCSNHCTYNTSMCAGVCGDAELHEDAGEDCDTGDDDTVAVADCRDLGFYDPGAVTCTNRCTMSIESCSGFCGDGMLNGGEFCEDGIAAGLQECIHFGFDVGDTTCSDDCAPDFSRCKHIGWRRVASAAMAMNDVWIRGDNDVFFATSSGLTRSLNGVITHTPLNEFMMDIVAISPTDAWAVGWVGALAHFDGTAWTSRTDPTLTSQSLSEAWAASSTSVFAVGTASTLLHYDGTSWETMTAPLPSIALYGVSGTSATNVIAVGNGGHAFHFDGVSWEDKPTGVTVGLEDVWFAAPNDAWAVGSGGTVLRFDGTQWTVQPSLGTSSLLAVWGRAPDDVYVASIDGVVFHYDGFSWWALATGANDGLVALDGTATSVYVLHNALGVYRHSGASWSRVSFPEYSRTAWLGPLASDITVLGISAVHRKTPLGFSADSAPFNNALRAFWSDGVHELVGTEDIEVLYFDGVDWGPPVLLGGFTLGPVTALWGSSATNMFAGTYNGSIFRSTNGTSWTAETTPGGSVSSIWGSSATDIYAAGVTALNDGAIWKRGATGTWTPVSLPVLPPLLDIWGSGPNNVFAVGQSGTILHFDGTSWTQMQSPVPHLLRGVGGSGPDDVFAVGDQSTVLHFDGASWSEVRVPPQLAGGVVLIDVAARNDLVVITGATGELFVIDRPGPW